ncbi:O-antigen ligase family protein [Neptuniibacter sp. QD34_54]|uniref:O-antigen ligase family protein n=1 Tax=Neptuniibacter sp. QD34_54 TaxID=3398208 RepID=UPI0039F4CFF5
MLASFKNMDILALARYYLTAVTCGLIVFSVTFQNSYNLFFALIFFSYIFFISTAVRQNINLSRIEKSLIIIMCLYIAAFILEVFLFGEKARLLDKPAKVLLLIPLIPILNAVKLEYRYIVAAFTISSVALLLTAGYEIYILDYDRAGRDINPIQFSAIAISIASVALSLAMTIKNTKKVCLIPLVCLAAGGLWAGLLSQSKGSIIAIPIIAVLICCLILSEFQISKIKASIFIILLISLSTTALYNSSIQERFHKSIENTLAFSKGSKTDTSSGIRLGQWKLALEAGQISPIIGLGYSAFTEYKNQQVMAGRYGQELLNYDNSHNAYANAFARRGVIGLLTIIIFLGFPIYIGMQVWRQKQKELAPFAVALSSFGCVFFIANITQEVIFLNTGIIMYTGLLVILTSMLAERIKASESDPAEEQLSSNQ